MLKNKKIRLIVVLSITALLSLTILASPASGLISQKQTSWYWKVILTLLQWHVAM